METQGHACLRKCNEMRYISHVCYQGLCVTEGYTQTTITLFVCSWCVCTFLSRNSYQRSNVEIRKRSGHSYKTPRLTSTLTFQMYVSCLWFTIACYIHTEWVYINITTYQYFPCYIIRNSYSTGAIYRDL